MLQVARSAVGGPESRPGWKDLQAEGKRWLDADLPHSGRGSREADQKHQRDQKSKGNGISAVCATLGRNEAHVPTGLRRRGPITRRYRLGGKSLSRDAGQGRKRRRERGAAGGGRARPVAARRAPGSPTAPGWSLHGDAAGPGRHRTDRLR
jgi:hypothetical protein